MADPFCVLYLGLYIPYREIAKRYVALKIELFCRILVWRALNRDGAKGLLLACTDLYAARHQQFEAAKGYIHVQQRIRLHGLTGR